MSKTIEIKISNILEDLTNGYTRIKNDKKYDPKIGSIQEKYGLNRIQVFELFKHDKLKGKKTITKKEPAFTIIDDTNGEEVTTVLVEDDEEKTEEVSTPDTKTSTDIDDTAAEEVPADTETITEAESSDQDNSWL